jgi:hypothetical protein
MIISNSGLDSRGMLIGVIFVLVEQSLETLEPKTVT